MPWQGPPVTRALACTHQGLKLSRSWPQAAFRSPYSPQGAPPLRYGRKEPSPSGNPQISLSYFLQTCGIPLPCVAPHSSPIPAIYFANLSFYKDFGSDPEHGGLPGCVSGQRRAEYTRSRSCTGRSVVIRISSRAGSAPHPARKSSLAVLGRTPAALLTPTLRENAAGAHRPGRAI